ncbi:DUF6299 family protein [Streptomyces sp. NBC_00572]|uniref:DUF6299 family protein n=1 Tax=Streptomyces sp. NBC_00572 TaxID=2903664 RepID=UPI00225BEE0B|nr:DUF6299 family protein [Streptomyces sp. NBC_00572]MCX4979959.1 DUF6299 family protein [Streptomyces sp. NBC_00572]
MRARLVLAAGVLLASAAVAPLAHAGGADVFSASEGADGLSVFGYGTVADDSTVTLSGTYRCLDDSAGPVFVSSTLVQGDRSAGIGGTRAVCDGHLHEWVNTSVVKDPAYRQGTARVQATLMQLTSGGTGLPTPDFLAVEESDVELR